MGPRCSLQACVGGGAQPGLGQSVAVASVRRDSGVTHRETTGLSVTPVRKASTLDSSHGPTPAQ